MPFHNKNKIDKNLITFILHCVDVVVMNKIVLVTFPVFLLAQTPFDTPQSKQFDLSCFNTKKNELNTMASQNKKIKCRWVCDKKVYKEQKIAEAISFYKSSKNYSFKDVK